MDRLTPIQACDGQRIIVWSKTTLHRVKTNSLLAFINEF